MTLSSFEICLAAPQFTLIHMYYGVLE